MAHASAASAPRQWKNCRSHLTSVNVTMRGWRRAALKRHRRPRRVASGWSGLCRVRHRNDATTGSGPGSIARQACPGGRHAPRCNLREPHACPRRLLQQPRSGACLEGRWTVRAGACASIRGAPGVVRSAWPTVLSSGGPTRTRTWNQRIRVGPEFPPARTISSPSARAGGVRDALACDQGRSSPQVVSAPSGGVPPAWLTVAAGRTAAVPLNSSRFSTGPSGAGVTFSMSPLL
jgi:hypothetical protein